MNKPIQSIVVVGTDLHAWTVALGLIMELGHKGVSIKVVGQSQDERQGVLSLDSSAHSFHQRSGLKEASLISTMGGSYRYGIKLSNQSSHSSERIFSYSATGEMLNRVDFHQYLSRLNLSRLKLLAKEADLAQYSLTAQAALEGKFSHPAADSKLAKIDYNLQLDRLRYLLLLKNTAMNHGVSLIEHDVVAAKQSDDGAISRLDLTSGDSISTDFVFDCSGFIFDQVLNIQHESFADTVRFNRCLSWSAPCGEATSLLNGVKGLQHACLLTQSLPGRMAYTLNYHHQQLTDKQALEMASGLSQDLSPEQFEFGELKAHMRVQHWVDNAVATGSVAGSSGNFIFSELFHTQTALARWLDLYPNQEINPHLSAQYNNATATEYRRVLDVHGLLLTIVDNNSIALPATLEHRIQLFAATGNVAFYEEDVFDRHQWVNLLMACGIWPQRCDVMLSDQSPQTISELLAAVKRDNQALIASMPSLDALLAAIRQTA